MDSRPYYRTIVLSDIHLGTAYSKVTEVSDFLSSVNCDRLILNGDIIDGWHLQKSGVKKWKSEHTRFFKILMKMMENCGTEVIYVRGNHDDFLDNLVPLQFGGIRIVHSYVLDSGNKRYFVTHGDVFDKITSGMKWLAKLGDVGYTLLLKLNGFYNRDFESVLAGFARDRGCDGVICGHIHHPENRMVDGIHYLNSGDWVETLSALTEDAEGQWNIVYYTDWMFASGRNEESHVLPIIPVAS